jgi:hypothetical protein
MARTELGDILRRSLRLRPGSTDILSNRESNQLEFKLSFDLRSGSEYARSMAAFANNEGGYLVFGVRNAPHVLVGIPRDRFEAVDPVKVTDILNSYFSPEIQWDSGLLEFEGRSLGFFYTYQALEKPIIATKSSGNEIKESGVYYRYRGKSSLIRYPELRKIIEDRLDRERKAWLQHLETISKSGPTKVGIIDTVQGKVFGAGAPFLIDEKLLRQLKFIREGSFSDTGGPPTLRLMGDLKTVDGITVEKIVQTGIHYDDLVTAFLAQRQLDKEDAKSYLVECAHQTTPYTPILYFLSQTGITPEDAIALLDAEKNTLKNTLAALKKRLSGAMRVTSFGRIDDSIKLTKVGNSKELLEQVIGQPSGIPKRSLIYQALRQFAGLLRGIALEIPCGHLFEAISNLTKHDIQRGKPEILGCLLDVFNQRFQTLKGGEKTLFRKAVACVEEQLYG